MFYNKWFLFFLQCIPDFKFVCFVNYLKMISFIICLRRLHLFFPILQRSFCKMPNKSIYLSKLLLSLNVVACGNHKKYICIFSKGTRKNYINIKNPSAITREILIIIMHKMCLILSESLKQQFSFFFCFV